MSDKMITAQNIRETANQFYQFLNKADYANAENLLDNYVKQTAFAKVYRYPPDTSKCEELQIAEEKAKLSKFGIWSGTIQSPPPTPPLGSSTINCSTNIFNCADFKTQAEAQNIFEKCGGKTNDIHKLDQDKDGIACESLN